VDHGQPPGLVLDSQDLQRQLVFVVPEENEERIAIGTESFLDADSGVLDDPE
jgi:hypothetical protein